MNILKEFHDLLEERPNEPEVMIMLTRQQANELYEAIHRIIALEDNKKESCNVYNMSSGQAYDKGFDDGLEEGLKVGACGDCISREASICLADELKDDLPDDDRLSDMVMSHNEGILEYQTQLSLLPSVTPAEKVGQWIAQDIHNCHTDFRCSECDYIHSFMHLYGKPTADYTYCPNCGAKMQEVEE